MPHIVQRSAQGSCDHQGTATANAVEVPNVKIDGQPILAVPSTFSVVGCTLNASGSPAPCATLLFTKGAGKVKANKMPVLLDNESPKALGPLGIQG